VIARTRDTTVDSHTNPVPASDIGRRLVPAMSAGLTAPTVSADRPSDVAALLRTIATTAAGMTELLDVLRSRYPAVGLDGPDPVAAVLDQAAAAAHDLRSSAETAASTIVNRAPDDRWCGPRPDIVLREMPRPSPTAPTEGTAHDSFEIRTATASAHRRRATG